MAATAYLESELMKYSFTASVMGTRPAAWYLALHTADPTNTGAVAEVTAGVDASYARNAVTFTQSASQVSNTGAVTCNAVNAGSAGYTVTHVSVWDAVTAGNCLFYGPLDLAKALVAGDVLSFAVGEIVLSMT